MSTTPSNIGRVAMVFGGGPAPAANAVISSCAGLFLQSGIEPIGLLDGYSHVIGYRENQRLVEGRDYVVITRDMVHGARNRRGVMLGTARTNPGRQVSSPAHLSDPVRTAPLNAVYSALVSLGVHALISIGGDDTLSTGYKIALFQQNLPADRPHIPVVHLPKTIDNDYFGIDYTFGHMTAVDLLSKTLRNLLADAEAGHHYFLAELMGRSAGYIAYGAGAAGEASVMLSAEDIRGKFAGEEVITDQETGQTTVRPIMNVDEVVRHMVQAMRVRESNGRDYGVIVVAESLAELLPLKYLEGIARCEHEHPAISQLNIGRRLAGLVQEEYERQTGKTRKVTSLQLGYEARCARPSAFDVLLGSQLGVGAYRAIVEEKLSGVMVSVAGQFELRFIKFEELINPETLQTTVRRVDTSSDFYRLIRFLEGLA